MKNSIRRVVFIAAVFTVACIAVGMTSAQQTLRAQASTHSVVLTWTASTTTLTGLGYSIYRGTTSGGESGIPINSSLVAIGCQGAACTYTDANVTAQTTYYYKAAACVPSGSTTVCSSLSNEASALIPLVPNDIAPPTGLSGSAN